MTDEDRFWRNRSRVLAAQLVAEDELTDAQIAEKCGHKRNWLATLKNDVRFRARVNFLIEQLRAAIADRGIVERRNRVDALNVRADDLRGRKRLLEKVIAERAEYAANVEATRRARYEATPEEDRAKRYPDGLPVIPGGATGVFAHGFKGVANIMVETWELDSALLAEIRGIDAELRATEKQAAQELGQWTEKRELTGKGGGAIILRWDDGEEA